MIKFYYGMSGSFKATTIMAEENKLVEKIPIVWSMIKPWKYYESNIFGGLTAPDHLNYAMLHLCNFISTIKNSKGKDILVERGVSDPIFYWVRDNRSAERNNIWIINAVQEELALCNGFGGVEKTLLIMKDKNFIENVILKEPSRAKVFPLGSISYLADQEKYVDFTLKYNNVDNIIEITDAKDYIEKLGLVYNENI